MFFKGLIASLLMLLTAPLFANLGQDNEGFGLGLDTSLIQRYQNQYHFFGAGGVTHALSPYLEYKSQRDIYTLYMLFADTNYFSELYKVEKGTIRGRFTIIGLNPDKIFSFL